MSLVQIIIVFQLINHFFHLKSILGTNFERKLRKKRIDGTWKIVLKMERQAALFYYPNGLPFFSLFNL
jgi:hypothetical protein